VESTVDRLYTAVREAREAADRSRTDMTDVHTRLAAMAADLVHAQAAAAAQANATAAAVQHAWTELRSTLEDGIASWRRDWDAWHAAARAADADRAYTAEALAVRVTYGSNLTAMVLDTLAARLEQHGAALTAQLTDALDAQRVLYALQQRQLSALRDTDAVVSTLADHVRGAAQTVDRLGGLIARALGAARRVLFQILLLLVGAQVAHAIGRRPLPFVVAWAWLAVVEASVLVGGLPGVTDAAARVAQWLPLAVWLAASLHTAAERLGRAWLWRCRQPAPAAEVAPQLIEYIVALRRQGPAAAVPPALLDALCAPPPGYMLAAPCVADTDDDAEDGDWLVACS